MVAPRYWDGGRNYRETGMKKLPWIMEKFEWWFKKCIKYESI